MDKEEKEILEYIRELKKELKPLKEYRLSNTCDPHWDMGSIEDMSMFYCINILKLRERIEKIEEKVKLLG